MSPRAAWRLERLGFTAVYDYVPGKMDWLSHNLPHEGDALLAGDLVHHDDVPTCTVDERLGDVRERLGDATRFCVVIVDGGLVAGVLEDNVFDLDDHVTAEDAMQFGVSTVRPSGEAAGLVERMQRAQLESLVVTNSDGGLIGLLVRHEAESRLEHRPRGGVRGTAR